MTTKRYYDPLTGELIPWAEYEAGQKLMAEARLGDIAILPEARPQKLPGISPSPVDEKFFLRLDTDELLNNIFPELAGTSGIDTVKQMMRENPQGFVDEIKSRGRTEDAESLLRQVQAKPDEIDQVFGQPQVAPLDIESLVKQVWPETNLANFAKFVEDTPDQFQEAMQSGGRTQPKQDLLKAMGLSWNDINLVFLDKPVVIPVDGVRQLLTVTKEGQAFDDKGKLVASYNNISGKFTKPESALKDFWDALQYSSRQYWESFEGFALGVLPNIIYPEIDPKAYGGLGGFLNETNTEMRDNFRWLYNENKQEYETWIKKNPDMAPDVKFQEGAFQHPELLKDPRYYAYELANIVPFLVATTVMAIGTGGVGAGFVALSTTGMGAVEGGQIYSDLINAGAPSDKAAQLSLVAGGLIGGLESVGRIPLLKQVSPLLFKGFKREVSKELTKRTMWEVAKRFGKNFTVSQFAEVSTEVLQEVVGNTAVSFYDENRGVLDNLGDIAVKTAVATLLPSAVGGGVSVRPSIRADVDARISEVAGKLKPIVKKALADEKGFIGFGEEAKKPEVPAVPEKVAPAPEVTKLTDVIPTDFTKSNWGELSARDYAKSQGMTKKVVGDIAWENSKGEFIRFKSSSRDAHTLKIYDSRSKQIVDVPLSPLGVEAVKPALPTAAPGMPEAGVQETMLPGEVSAKEVFPKGKGVPTQISMDEAARLEAMRAETEAGKKIVAEARTKGMEAAEAREAERALLSEEEAAGVAEFEKQGELEGLKAEHAADPASKFIDVVAKVGSYKGEINTLTRHQYRLLTGAEWRTQKAEIGGKKVTKKILVGGSEPTPGMMEMEGGISTGRIRWEYALDTIATEAGYPSGDALKVGIEKALERKHRIDQLEGVVGVAEPVRAIVPAKPIIKAQEISPEIRTSTEMTPEQATGISKMFGEMISHPDVEQRRALTIEMRKRVLAQRASNAQAIAEQYFIEGKSAEDAINLAKKEAMPGKLPTLTSEELGIFVEEFRTALFAKVYQYWQNDWFEMMSTAEALTHALATGDIPRKVGTGTKVFPGGGSAYLRLQRVFGDQPEVLKALEQKKPIQDVVEGIFRESGQEPTPLDQDMVGYLRKLSTVGEAPKLTLGKTFELRTVEDLRTPAQKKLALEVLKIKYELTKARAMKPSDLPAFEEWDPDMLHLYLQSGQEGLLHRYSESPTTADYRTAAEKLFALRKLELGTALAEKRITKETYDIEMAIAQEKVKPYPPVTQYEAPINDALKQPSMMPMKQRLLIVRALQEVGATAIDIGNFLRGNLASFDFSWWRQNAPLIMNNLPQFMTGNIEAFKSVWSQKAAEASWERISRHDPLYQIYEQGADFLRPLTLPKGTAQWKGVEEYGFLGTDRPIPKFTEKLPWVKVSQRAFVTGANEMNWAIYHKFYDAQLKIQEKVASGEIKLKSGEALNVNQNMIDFSKMLADLTGRAQLGKLGAIAPAANALFFSLRLNLGRLLTPRHLVSANSYVRAEAWKNLSLFVGTMGGVILMGSALDWWDVDRDSRSTNFMKVRIGNIRIDPWGGYQQFVVFASRIFTKTGLVSATGMEYEVDPLSAMTNWIRGKASPMAGLIADFWTGKTFLGDKVDIKNKEQWLERLVPFAMRDIWDAFTEKGPVGALVALPAIVGANVQTYTGDWKDNALNLGLPKYSDNLPYGITTPIYDTADFWTDTASQFKGVDPSTLTEKKGFPPKIKAIAEALAILDGLKDTPNTKLTSINADPSKGNTFVQYYAQWQERLKITDPEKLRAFDADERTKDAQLGNITQRQYALLTKYHSLSKAEQTQFLKDNPELDINPRTDWLKSHPKENAQLAVWGQAKILSLEAYNETKRLLKALDIPDNAIPELTMPPEKSVKNYFEYQGMVADDKSNSWEAQLLLAKDDDLRKWLEREPVDTPIASLELKVKNRKLFDLADSYSDKESPNYFDDKVKDKDGLTARDRAQAKLKADNPKWVDDIRRIEAIEHKPPDDKTTELWVERGKTIDKFGGGSSESKVWLIDHPEVHKWALEQELLADDGSDWNPKVLRINTKWRELDDKYKALGDDASTQYIRNEKERLKAREKLLADNPEYRDDTYRREIYGKGVQNEAMVGDYVAYRAIVDKFSPGSAEAKLFRMEHPDLQQWAEGEEAFDWSTLTKSYITKLRLDVKWRPQDAEYDAIKNPDEAEQTRLRNEYLAGNKDYRQDRRRREAYTLTSSTGEKFPDAQVENYVNYFEIPARGFRQERFLVENPEFANAMHTIKGVDLPNPKKVPAAPYDDLYDQFKESFDKWDAYGDPKSKSYRADPDERRIMREALLRNTDFADAKLRRQAYSLLIGNEKYVEAYVGYEKILQKGKPPGAELWFEDDRYLMKNQDFYRKMLQLGYWTQEVNFAKVPTERFEKYYNENYTEADKGKARLAFRATNPWFDDEGAKLGYWKVLEEKEREALIAGKPYTKRSTLNLSEIDEILKKKILSVK